MDRPFLHALPDTTMPAGFYATARGAVAARVLRHRLVRAWPDLTGADLLGVGWPMPYLLPWRRQARRAIAAVPSVLEPRAWPAGVGCAVCSIEGDRLPFPDLSLDRVLLVHGLEQAGDARRLLREVWRVLRDDGRLLIVVPNRRGAWAHVESTPFGQGKPYSQGQLDRLLRRSMFRAERRTTALFVPPLRWRPLLRLAPACEQAGPFLLPEVAGLILTEAVKEAYAAMPLRPARRTVLVSEAA
jgi:SAM-dependent methyltransferase